VDKRFQEGHHHTQNTRNRRPFVHHHISPHHHAHLTEANAQSFSIAIDKLLQNKGCAAASWTCLVRRRLWSQEIRRPPAGRCLWPLDILWPKPSDGQGSLWLSAGWAEKRQTTSHDMLRAKQVQNEDLNGFLYTTQLGFRNITDVPKPELGRVRGKGLRHFHGTGWGPMARGHGPKFPMLVPAAFGQRSNSFNSVCLKIGYPRTPICFKTHGLKWLKKETTPSSLASWFLEFFFVNSYNSYAEQLRWAVTQFLNAVGNAWHHGCSWDGKSLQYVVLNPRKVVTAPPIRRQKREKSWKTNLKGRALYLPTVGTYRSTYLPTHTYVHGCMRTW